MVAEGHVVAAIRVEPASELHVQLAAALLGDQAVGGFVQQCVDELLPARSRRLDQLTVREAVELGSDMPARQRLDGGDREVPPGNGCDAHDLALRFGQRLQPRGQQDLDRPGQPIGVRVVADERREMLGEQRVALGRLDHPRSLVVRQ